MSSVKSGSLSARPAEATDRHERGVRARAKAAEEAEAARASLLRKIAQDDARLRLMQLDSRAAMEKRQADLFDPRPARRKMYDDHVLELASQIPGPGEYTPRLWNKDSAGKTFGGTGSLIFGGSSCGGSSVGSPRSSAPGPASYSPGPRLDSLQRSPRASTFGLPPHLSHGRQPPSAHDMSTMVKHLVGLPGPGAHSPRDPMEKNKGFRIKPSTGAAWESFLQEVG